MFFMFSNENFPFYQPVRPGGIELKLGLDELPQNGPPIE
jgi:hypothetical protein